MTRLLSSIVRQENHVTIISINRPASLNALDEAANAELTQVFDEFERDPEQWVGILTGEGERAFCAGYDLKSAWSSNDPQTLPKGFAGITWRYDLIKPTIAAVNGVAMGGGFEAALACDIIVAAENAMFALSEPRVGLAALGGGLHRLPRAIGYQRAMGLILTGRQVSAEEGLELGFVNQVVPKGQALEIAQRWANDICRCSPASIQASKQVVINGIDRPLKGLCEAAFELPAVKALFNSGDAVEGPRAFAQKRPPRWQS